MALYLIGDVQGCDGALKQLLEHIDFSPSRDTIYLLGDLVNRGPDSSAVLRRLMALGQSAHCLLGNHDLHVLAVAAGVRAPGRRDTIDAILHAPDRGELLDWLRHQHMAIGLVHGTRECLLVHAGVLPGWSVAQTLGLAGEVEQVLRSGQTHSFFENLFANTPTRWQDDLQGWARLRVIVNALTRLRFCTPEGEMEFETKEGGAAQAPAGFMPWFDVPNRKTAHSLIAFGHWSTLGLLQGPDIVALDTGCVWGGQLTALRLSPDLHQAPDKVLQVQCPQAQAPTNAKA